MYANRAVSQMSKESKEAKDEQLNGAEESDVDEDESNNSNEGELEDVIEETSPSVSQKPDEAKDESGQVSHRAETDSDDSDANANELEGHQEDQQEDEDDGKEDYQDTGTKTMIQGWRKAKGMTRIKVKTKMSKNTIKKVENDGESEQKTNRTDEQVATFKSSLSNVILDSSLRDVLGDAYRTRRNLADVDDVKLFIMIFIVNHIGSFRLSTTNAEILEKERQRAIQMYCFEGHVLIKTRSTYRLQLGYYCNLCGVEYRAGTFAYACEGCDYDACLKCHMEHLISVRNMMEEAENKLVNTSGKWMAKTDVFIAKSYGEVLWSLLQSAIDGSSPKFAENELGLVSLLRVLRQIHISHHVTLTRENVECVLSIGRKNLPAMLVMESLCGLLTAGPRLPLDARQVVFEEAMRALTCYPGSDLVAEEAIRLVLMYGPSSEKDLLDVMTRIASIRANG